MKNEKDKKIQELEEIIQRMQKDHSQDEEITENNSTDSRTVEADKENTINEIEMPNLIDNNFFSSEIQKIKDDIISEVKKGLKQNKKVINNNNKLKNIKKDMNNLNKKLNENINQFNDIQNDL